MNSTSSFQQVVRDVVDLVELQMQLLSVDSQAAKRKLVSGAVCGLVAATLAGSALTVLMIGGGFLLHELAELSTGVSLLIIAAVVFLLVGILLYLALVAVQAAAAAMQETKSEFAENLRWLKATLIAPSTSPRNQLRAEDFPTAGNHGAPRWADDPSYNPKTVSSHSKR